MKKIALLSLLAALLGFSTVAVAADPCGCKGAGCASAAGSPSATALDWIELSR